MHSTRFYRALQVHSHWPTSSYHNYKYRTLTQLSRIIESASPHSIKMAPKGKKRGQDYDSDGGFVKGENGGTKSKKQKIGKITGLANQAGSKDAKKGESVAGGGSVSTNGEVFWEVSRRGSWKELLFFGKLSFSSHQQTFPTDCLYRPNTAVRQAKSRHLRVQQEDHDWNPRVL